MSFLFISKLEYLDLLGLDQIEGDSFVNLPEKLPNLTLLILVQCNRVSMAVAVIEMY